LGWYFPINDYVHVRLTGDIYTRGSHGIRLSTTYKKRYKYTGKFELSYDFRKTEIATDIEPLRQRGFSILLDHDQDSKAHPFINIGGRINIVGNNNENRVRNDATSVLTNTYTSNFYFRHSMPNTPFNFNLGLNHSQNTRTHAVTLTLPDMSLNMNTIYPFKNKNRGGNKEAWYEKVSFDYDVSMKNIINTTDTTFLTSEVFEDMKTGVSHKARLGFSTRLFKNFNFVPNINYDEVWVLNTVEKDFDRIIEVDTNGVVTRTRDSLVTEIKNGFDTYRTYSAGASINTQLFGTMKFSKGWLRGIRHTLKPSVGYSYAPDLRSVYSDTLFYSDPDRDPLLYSRFDEGPYRASFSDLQSSMTLGLKNVVEIKHWSKKDSTEKKLKIFDNINVGTRYNFAKDSSQWDIIRVSSTTRLFKNISTLSTSWRFDPYLEDNKNRATATTVWSDRKKPARLEFGEIRLVNTLNVKKIKSFFKKQDKDDSNDLENIQNLDRTDPERQPDNPFDALVPDERSDSGEGRPELDVEGEKKKKLVTMMSLIENIRISHNFVYEFRADKNNVQSKVRTHTLAFSGSIPLTENWTIGIGNIGYDFANKGLSYTRVTFSRKLHCWNMNFSWSPNRNTYTFFIGVNSSHLSFLKYNYGQNAFDGLRPF